MNTVKLKDIATIYNGNSINKTEKQQKYMKDVPGWNYIATKDVDFDGTVTYKNGVVIPFSETKFRTAPVGTVFVCSEGGSAGKKTAIINEEVCFGNKLFALVNDKGLFNPKYLFYYTRYEGFLKQFKILATSLMGGISVKNFGNIEIPLPKLDMQESIVKKIDEQLSSLDNAVETLNKTKEQLAIYRQAVLKEAFLGGLINEKPVEKRLGEYIEKPKYGTSKKCDYRVSKNSVGVFRIPNIDAAKGIMDYGDIKYAAFEEKELENLDLEAGDLLIIRSNGSPSIVGTVAMIREKDTSMTFAGYLMRLRIKNKSELLPKYVRYYFASLDARTYIERVAKSTSGVNNINAQEVSNLPIPYMAPDKQEAVIFEIESRLSVYEEIEKNVDMALKQAEALRQSVLKKAFEGRLA